MLVVANTEQRKDLTLEKMLKSCGTDFLAAYIKTVNS